MDLESQIFIRHELERLQHLVLLLTMVIAHITYVLLPFIIPLET